MTYRTLLGIVRVALMVMGMNQKVKSKSGKSNQQENCG